MKKKLNIKNIFNKKENIVITAIALLFCVGLVVTKMNNSEIPLHDGDVLVDSQTATEESNQSLNDNSDNNEGTKATDNFKTQRAELDLKRNEIIAKFDDTINNSNNKSEKKNAVEEKEALVNSMKEEVAIESIITSKGLPSCFVIISESGVTITVNEKELKQDVVAKICNIAMEETNLSADKIVVQSSY